MAAFPNGAGIVADDAWVLAEEQPGRALGAALAWAHRQGAVRLHLILSQPPATAEIAAIRARRASLFSSAPDIWLASGRELTRVDPAPIQRLDEPPPAELSSLREQIQAAGADPVYEWGTLSGDLLGLEVCRATNDGGRWRLSVGVGKYDREIHDTIQSPDALTQVIAEVRRHRQARTEAHPASTLATERWLRAVVMAHPDLVGASTLRPIETTERRTDLRQPAPAAAVGADAGGRPMLVVCTAGAVDLEVIPIAADTRLSLGSEMSLVIAVDPPVDARITRDLAAALRDPATVTVVPRDWRGLLA